VIEVYKESGIIPFLYFRSCISQEVSADKKMLHAHAPASLFCLYLDKKNYHGNARQVPAFWFVPDISRRFR
jgi:hypothetical protein